MNTYPTKRVLPIVLFILIFNAAHAQIFSFKNGTADYVPLQNPILISDSLNHDSYDVGVNMGLDFDLFGQDMYLDSVLVGNNGFMLIGSVDQQYVVALDPMVTELEVYNSSSRIVHGIDTVDGVRYYVVEWQNVGIAELSRQFANVQIRIETANGNVHFHYGSTNVVENTESIGGLQCGVFLLSWDFQSVYNMIFLKGDPDKPTPGSVNFGKLDEYPVAKTHYAFTQSTVGVGTELKPQISAFYPNPSSGSLNIDFEKTYSSIGVEICDLSGKSLENRIYSNTNSIRDHYSLTPGLYLLKVTTPNGTSEVKSWMVK